MLPAQRRQILIQVGVHRFSGVCQPLSGTFQVDRVPQHYCSSYQVEAAGSVALLLEAPIPNFTETVEEHRSGQGVARLAFVQPCMHATAQLDTLQPIQNEQRALDPAQLPQGDGQAVLA